MELSPPLRWLGALAVAAIALVITIPLLLDTVTDVVSLSGDTTSAVESEIDALPSAVPSEGSLDTLAEPSEAVAEAADDQASAAPSEDGEFPRTYTVVAGDTGTRISEQFYGVPDGWGAIAAANGIDPSDPLRVGVELEIPPPP